MTFQAKLDFQAFIVKFLILFLFYVMIDTFDWTWTENHLEDVLLMMDQHCIPEVHLSLACVSDLPGDDIIKLLSLLIILQPCIRKEGLFHQVPFDVANSDSQVASDLSKSIIILLTLPVKNQWLSKTP